jgi:anti-sigma B factor antagonist
MHLDSQLYGNILVVTAGDPRLDAAVAVQFKDRLREVAEDGPERVILDLSKVDFLDSSGLGAVVASMKILGVERNLELAGLTPTVAKVFRLTRMDTIFTIHTSIAHAIDSYANAS